jgi:hypothetical protein
MTIELIKTKETDGDWYKILVDGCTKAVVGIHDDEQKALKRITEIYDFMIANKGEKQVIKSETVFNPDENGK